MSKEVFFMIHVDGGNSPTYRHANIHLAETEAKRLTELTGKKSYILCTVKSIELPEKFKIEDCRPESEDLPF